MTKNIRPFLFSRGSLTTVRVGSRNKVPRAREIPRGTTRGSSAPTYVEFRRDDPKRDDQMGRQLCEHRRANSFVNYQQVNEFSLARQGETRGRKKEGDNHSNSDRISFDNRTSHLHFEFEESISCGKQYPSTLYPLFSIDTGRLSPRNVYLACFAVISIRPAPFVTFYWLFGTGVGQFAVFGRMDLLLLAFVLCVLLS